MRAVVLFCLLAIATAVGIKAQYGAAPYMSPTTSPYMGPATSPYMGPATSPYMGPATSPYMGPATSPYMGPATSPYMGPATSPYVGASPAPYMRPSATPYMIPSAATPMIQSYPQYTTYPSYESISYGNPPQTLLNNIGQLIPEYFSYFSCVYVLCVLFPVTSSYVLVL